MRNSRPASSRHGLSEGERDDQQRTVETTRETDESYVKGEGAEPFDELAEARLTADGELTILVIEVRGILLDKVACHGAGGQIQAENLAAYLAGR